MSNVKLFDHQIKALELTKDKNRVAIKGYEGLYEIDNLGNVYSIITSTGRRKGILKPYLNTSGHLRVNLYKDAKGKKFYVHRLVAQAFIPNSLGLEVVNHKDGNKLNNCVSNLEWCTQKSNIKHSFDNKLESRSKETYVDGIKFNNMKEASIKIFGNIFEISHKRRKLGNKFVHKGHVIKVGGQNE